MSQLSAPEGGRDAFFDDAPRFTPFVAAMESSSPLLVRTDDHVVGRMMFIKGTRPEIGTLNRTIAVLRAEKIKTVAGKLFVDIGANIGTSVIAALKTYGFAGALACEPEPENYRLLRANLVLNDLDDRVLTLPVAVSNTLGPQRLVLHPTNSGGHLLEPDGNDLSGVPDAPQEGRRVPVEKVTLDFLVERGLLDPSEVGLLWVDVQGSEGRVLKGAKQLVRRGTPVVFEAHPGLLDLSGGAWVLAQIIERDYTHFVDIRRTALSPRLRYELRPTSEFRGLIGELRAAGRFTDILALRR